MTTHSDHRPENSDYFPREPAGLPEARAPRSLELKDGDRFELEIAAVSKRIGTSALRMLAYNQSIPGPLLRVRQNSKLLVDVVNHGDLETTVHWHGLRLENRYDGTHQTQHPIPIGGRFRYRLEFPDPGVYWYHPHIREDYGQELGLYGNIVVVPADAAYWPQAHRELALTLDDILVEDGKIAPFRRSLTTFTAMGRFGNILLVNGEREPSLTARRDEIVRLYLTNTANARVFNVALPGARMKLVGGDSGHYEREQMVEDVLLGPSERAVVDVLFDEPGQLTLENRTPAQTRSLARIEVSDRCAEPSLAAQFEHLRTNSDLALERQRCSRHWQAAPDKTLALVAEMNLPAPELPPGATLSYFCPMHPRVVSDVPGKCPDCGMKLLARAAETPAYACPMHPEIRSEQPERCSRCGMKLVPAQQVRGSQHTDARSQEHPHAAGEHAHGAGAPAHDARGIEWEDDMLEVNRETNPTNTRWKLIDRETGAEGTAIDWRFRTGERVKIRLLNEMDSDHPMHHPFHVHGAGRFLILSRDGVVEPNLVWKDTVLIPTGQTVDLLLELTNPGLWMAHCHIAEHHESGMMFSFQVEA
jgi:FtsP/CotA-like multicopper oxidase with cupredoxin domain